LNRRGVGQAHLDHTDPANAEMSRSVAVDDPDV